MPHSPLAHVTRPLPGGGMVLVLNTGAHIPPEAEAMLQALHSRSIGGVAEHLEKLREKGAEEFMAKFYVGYGHKSIGDCGSITMFIEGVSMLAAKAIQDWPLYSGQESSTRYIDFSRQAFVNPTGTASGNAILEAWRAFYLTALPRLCDHLTEQFPRDEGEKETIYRKAISARAFDILRGFLPTGATTNLAWHSNLRQAADKLALLRHHPLAEVQTIASALEDALLEAFPSSFTSKRYDASEQYNAAWMREEYLFDHEPYDGVVLLQDTIDRPLLARSRAVLERRPPKTELPRHLAECGAMQFGFMLDFGSFRDIQRHRAVVQRMPLVTMRHGFHPWYLDALPIDLRATATHLLTTQEQAITALDVPQEIAQYYIAMGYALPNRLTGTLPALVYLAELRATRFVHPTLASVAGALAGILARTFADEGLVLHLDDDPGRFDVRRGEHDIIAREHTPSTG
ncbi:MAG: FAD-dependent thymidylate synthase [bacterium]|nr:FAD-dependent thymidylate synthase [bacterium]